jgi:pimeloyl-ACP methyl ester carboxylesterase
MAAIAAWHPAPVTRPPLPQLPGVEHRALELATGVRVHVALAGPEDAPRVLALHGWPQHWWMWRSVIERLRGDVRIACPDLRGLGWSGWPADGDFRKSRLAEDAIATLDALGWDRALLVGHDWGGVASWLAALDAPERLHGVLVLAAAHPWQPTRTLLANAWRFAYQLPIAPPRLGRAVMHDGRYTAAMLHAGSGNGFRFTPEETATYVDVLRAAGPARATEGYYRSFLLRDSVELGRAVAGRRLRIPARLLYGTREPLGVPLARGLERHGDDARLELLPGAGHWLAEERPDEVAAAIRARLAVNA